MFDTYNSSNSSHTHSHKHTVTERRAPTDESVKLLNEMQQKALDNVIQSIRIEGNTFNVVALQMIDDPTSFDHKIGIAFELNSKKYTEYIIVDRVTSSDKYKMVEIIISKISEKFAEVMIKSEQFHKLINNI